MIRRVSHLALALIVVVAVLAPTALASGGKPKKHHKGSGCGTSAACVYVEPPTSLGGSGSGNGPPVPLSAKAASELKKYGGADGRLLATMGTSRAFGVQPPRPGEAGSVGRVSPPSAFLAALDLGPGPIALFVALLAGAAAFGLGGALRRRRARQLQ